MQNFLRDFFTIFYPKPCVSCGMPLLRGEQFLCIQCQIEFPINPEINSQNNPAKAVFAGRLPLETANTLLYFSKGGVAQKLIHSLKYQDREDVGEFLGRKFAEELADFYTEKPDVVVPVPLHSSKHKLRGYNQCESIARGLAHGIGAKVVTDAIIRNQANVSQTTLNRATRFDNVAGIFELIKPQLLTNKHVLLVDDTLTTGATLESCGLEILKAENVKLSIATLAIAT